MSHLTFWRHTCLLQTNSGAWSAVTCDNLRDHLHFTHQLKVHCVSRRVVMPVLSLHHCGGESHNWRLAASWLSFTCWLHFIESWLFVLSQLYNIKLCSEPIEFWNHGLPYFHEGLGSVFRLQAHHKELFVVMAAVCAPSTPHSCTSFLTLYTPNFLCSFPFKHN